MALGIAKKIKINFLEVGHTHEDIDALIGSVVVKLRARDLPTLDSRVDAICGALKNEEARIRFVEEAMGITDYEKAFCGLLKPLPGIMAVKEIRITADDDGVPAFLYKSNSTIDGWYPRPFEPVHDMVQVNKVFKHFDPIAGNAVRVLDIKPGRSSKMGERGKRQHWYYTVEYARGDKLTHCLKCEKIRLSLLPCHDLQAIVRSLPAQPFSQSKNPLISATGRDAILASISSLLTARGGTKSVVCLLSFCELVTIL